MRARLRGCFAAIFCLLTCLSVLANPIVDGDALFFQMKYPEAVARYQLVSASAEAQWKIARALICQADMSEGDVRKALYYRAVDAARRALQLDNRDASAYTYLGASLGNVANYEGARTKVRLCNEIKAAIDRALALNPKDDVAWSILGSFYRALGGVGWLERKLANTFLGSLPSGGFGDGEAALKKAVQLAPTVMRHWFELGRLYQDWGKPALASQAFRTAQKLPVQLSVDRWRLQRIREFLANQPT